MIGCRVDWFRVARHLIRVGHRLPLIRFMLRNTVCHLSCRWFRVVWCLTPLALFAVPFWHALSIGLTCGRFGGRTQGVLPGYEGFMHACLP